MHSASREIALDFLEAADATAFVGRERDLSGLAALFADPAVRLVTLAGPPGIGKTRLAVRLAADLPERFDGGCWFADASEARSAAALAAAAAQALGVPPAEAADPVEQVAAALEGRKPLLLILDSIEPAGAAAAPVLDTWLRRAPRARILATGRAPAGHALERVVRVGPLTLPPARAADVAGSEAVRLFLERAREAKPGFAATGAEMAEIAEICRELEGIPLAIELAAARVRIMQPAMLVRKLGQKLQLLRSSRQDAAPRQATLEGTVEWSYGLLEEREKRAFVALSVFRGGWFAEAAAAVVGEAGGAEVLEALRGRSLLEARATPFGTRYSMFRLFRECAERLWGEHGGAAARRGAELRHAEHALASATALDLASEGRQARAALDRLELEVENVLAAHDRWLAFAAPDEAPDPEAAAAVLDRAARALLAVAGVLGARGPGDVLFPGLERVLRALEARADAAPRVPVATVTELLVAFSDAARSRGDGALSLAAAERAVAHAAPIRGAPAWAAAVRLRAWILGHRGEFEEAFRGLAEAEAAFRAAGHAPQIVETLNSRALLLVRRGEPGAALPVYEEAEAIGRRAGALGVLSTLVANKAAALATLGRFGDALAALTEAEEMSAEVGRKPALAMNLANRGALLCQSGNARDALACLERAAASYRDMGRRQPLATLRLHLAQCRAMLGDHAAAVREWSEAEALLRALDDRGHLPFAVAGRAESLEAAGDLDAAAHAAAEAEQLFRIAGHRQGEARACGHRGRLLLRAGQAGEGRDKLRAAAAEIRVRSHPDAAEFLIMAALAEAEAALGDRAEGARVAAEALALLPRATAWEQDPLAAEVRRRRAGLAGLTAIP